MAVRAWRALRLVGLAAALTALAMTASPTTALESATQRSPRAAVTLISEAAAVAPGQTFRIGLRQKLAPHWHTYWKNPGDAGAPPEIKLALPPGATASEIAWPGPDRIAVGPLVNFGYESEIVFPVTVQVPANAQAGQTFPIEAQANWLVCERECIPEEGTFRLDIPIAAGSKPASGDIVAAFARTDTRQVIRAPWDASISAEGQALRLNLNGDGLSSAVVRDAFFFPAEWGAVEHAAPQKVSVSDGRLSLTMARGQALKTDAPVSGLLAVTDPAGQTRWLAIAPRIGGTAGSTGASASAFALPFWQAALFAFLGGLLLNLMPCVFPVLAIKATSVASLSGGALREVRLSSLFYTLGVLAAFIALAALLIGLRASGAAVGWGFQFQSPIFVTAMAWLLFAIGLNLSGVYEVGMSMAGAGQHLTRKEGHAGSFFTGLLAVVVATPCTAPFMGAAIGTALAAPAIVALTLFLAMGLGLALPYALLGAFPKLAGLLPRPGAWTLRLRQAMAFPMYASAAWLVWVLVQQAGDFGLIVALAGALLIAVAAWLYGIAQHSGGPAFLIRGTAAVIVLATLALLPPLRNAMAPAAQTTAGAVFEPFSAARLAALRAEGKPVFINMTAAWCITCLVNEHTALATDEVRTAMQRNGVVYLKGDWTNRDPEITAFLRSFGRDGLPFYVFYPGANNEPVVLPSVLTQGIVAATLRGKSSS